MTSETSPSDPASVAGALLQVAAVAAQGVLHTAAAGALLLVAMRLAAPGVLEDGSAGRAWADAVALGLACLRVPLESGELSGTFAPLGGALLTLWGIAAAVCRWSPGWPGGRGRAVAGVAVAFAAGCLAAAAAVRPGAQVEPSLLGSALAGAAWGATGAAWATSPGRRATAGRAAAGSRGPRASATAAVEATRTRTARLLSAHPRLGPGVVAVSAAAVLGGLAAATLLLVGVAGSSAPAAVGAVLMGLAAAPNAVAAVVALGLGAPVEVVLDGIAVAGTSGETFALWDWAGRGVAPPHVLALAVVPLAAVLAGGRAAARVAADDSPLISGLAIGGILAAPVVAVGWAGSLGASAGDGTGAVTLRLGVPPLRVVVLSLLWGVAGAYLGPLVPRARLRGRRGAVEDAGERARPDARRG